MTRSLATELLVDACGLIALALVACTLLAGCTMEHAPTHGVPAQAAQPAISTSAAPEPAVDQALRVVASCGRPASDQVLSLHNKSENGPIRRMTYRHRQLVTLDFVPFVAGHPVSQPAQRTRSAGGAAVPSNAVWRFDEAHMEEEEFLSSARLGVYLPCAANVIARDE